MLFRQLLFGYFSCTEYLLYDNKYTAITKLHLKCQLHITRLAEAANDGFLQNTLKCLSVL